VLEYDEENNQMDATAVFSHPNQIWALEPSPRDMSLVLTSSRQSDGTNPVVLYKLPGQDIAFTNTDDDGGRAYEKDIQPPEELAQLTFGDAATFVNSFAWHTARDSVLTLDPASLTMWNIREGSVEVRSHHIIAPPSV
jgi:hypothetical protein